MLLECIVDWISANSRLCSDSVRLVRIQSTFTCPIGGLVRWCILGPLVTATVNIDKTTLPSVSTQKENSSDLKNKNTFSSEKLQSLFSRLHLAVLQSLQAYRSMELQEHLLTFTDLFIVSKTLIVFFKGGQCSEHFLPFVNTSTDRLAQIIQVALTTKSLPGKIIYFDLIYWDIVRLMEKVEELSNNELTMRCIKASFLSHMSFASHFVMILITFT